MKDLLKQHYYAKESYSLGQVQTKKTSEFMHCIFTKKKYGSAFASTFKLHATVSLAANNHILDTAGTDDNSENTESNLSSATQGIVRSDDHDPPNNDQANASN